MTSPVKPLVAGFVPTPNSAMAASTSQQQQTTQVVMQQEDSQPKGRCNTCCKSFLSFLVSTVGLTLLMVGYTVLGGFIFMKLEAPNEVILKSNVQMSRKWHVDLLWNLTYKLNIFYPDNWTKMADEIMENYTREVYIATKNKGWDGKDGESELQWTFAGALLYSITVITTIGRATPYFYLNLNINVI